MTARAAILFLAWCSVWLAGCRGPDESLLYQSPEGEDPIWAVSVRRDTGLAEVERLVAGLNRPGRTGFVYPDYQKQSATEPLAVFRNGALWYYDPQPSSSSYGTTIGDVIAGAVYQTGTRTGAVCANGTRSSATGSGACSHRGGVAAWRYEEIPDSGAVVASICRDGCLLSGSAEGCSHHLGLQAEIRNRDLRTYLPSSGEVGVAHDIEVDDDTMELVEKLSSWAAAGISVDTARVLYLPGVRELPTDPEELAALLPPEHRVLVTGLVARDVEISRKVLCFDPTRFCFDHEDSGAERAGERTIETVTFAREYFLRRTVDVAKGHGDPVAFDWIVAFEPREKLLYSFIFNLEEMEDD